MYKQIIETFEPKFVPIVLDKDETLSYMQDDFMMTECAKIVSKIEDGLPLDMACKFVKDFQAKYIGIKKQDEEIAKHFTIDIWAKTMKLQ